jgi:Lrp/AsnC family transcriptional regulator
VSHQLDRYERQILALLQEDATLTTGQIAEQIGLSVSPCWRRIDRLEREGFIVRRVTMVDRRKVGLNAQLFVQIKLNAHGRANLDEFAAAIRQFPEVLECHVLLGSVDFLLRVVAADIEAYERFFFNRLSQLPGVQEVNSTVALSQIKSTTSLPIPGASPDGTN